MAKLTADVSGKLMSPMDEALSPETLGRALTHARLHDPDATDILFAQTHILNNMFARFLDKGLGAEYITNGYDPSYINANYMALALQVQTQCRMTAQAMKAIRTTPDLPDFPSPEEQTERP